MQKRTYTTHTADETMALASQLAADLRGQLVYLKGDLGAGKTTFVRGLAKGLGLTDRVVSPTFTYERIYGEGENLLYHFDLYRIGPSGDPLIEEELYELTMQPNTTVLIEWPEKLALTTQRKPILLEFIVGEGDTRTITFSHIE